MKIKNIFLCLAILGIQATDSTAKLQQSDIPQISKIHNPRLVPRLNRSTNSRLSQARKNIIKKNEIAKPIDTLLLTALPGSGKSEVRKYFSSLSEKECKEKFGIGPTVQLDDFPYVHMMRRISEELVKHGQRGEYFLSPAFSFRNPKEWGTLIHLINEDYDDLISYKKASPESASIWLFDRLDRARMKTGAKAVLKKLTKEIRNKVANAIQPEAEKLLKEKNEEIEKAKNLKEKTIVIEFARGGADSAPMPLPEPYGYEYAFAQLSPQILEKASVLYIWVSPEESRRKNEARANPNDPGSILNHAVPRSVMFAEYGCDDIDWLSKTSKRPGTITVVSNGKEYLLPFGKFDNRVDRTTFVRNNQSLWKKEEVQDLRSGLEKAFSSITSNLNIKVA